MNSETTDLRGGTDRRFRLLAALLGLLLLAPGCGPKVSRVEHAAVFHPELREKTAAVLPGRPLTALECVRIALDNNLDLRVAEIGRRLATLDRKAAFGLFLPQIEFRFGYSGTDNPQLRQTGGGVVQLSDQRIHQTEIEAQQAVFLPQAWLLYDIRGRGEEISSLLRDRARQMISLQVATLYFAVLTLEDAESYLGVTIENVEALLGETRAFEREGMALPSQRQEVETLLLESTIARDNVRRLLAETRAELMVAMGLDPFGKIGLVRQAPFLPFERRSLEEDALEALTRRLELHVDDRTLEIRKREVQTAIAAFLPRVAGLGSFTHSSDSFLVYSNVWTYGVGAVLSAFDGFRNLFGYRAAREREKEAFVRREQRCMAILLEVLRARHRVDQAADYAAVASKNLETAEERLRESRALWDEGMIQFSELLDAVTEKERAGFIRSMAGFQQQVALATLGDVLGRTPKEP